MEESDDTLKEALGAQHVQAMVAMRLDSARRCLCMTNSSVTKFFSKMCCLK